jgi:hypothetical protein
MALELRHPQRTLFEVTLREASHDMTFYIVYSIGILVAAIATRSVIRMNRELRQRNRAAREQDEREGLENV